MRLEHEYEVAAPVDDLYAAFTDVRRVGRCFPGAEVTSVEGDEFTGSLTTRVGPITLTYGGEGRMTLRDPEGGRAALQASGGERRGFGRAHMASTVFLAPVSESRTRVRLVTTIEVFGSPVDLGGGLAQRVSEPSVERFVRAMANEPGATEEAEFDVAHSVMAGLIAPAGRSLGRLFGRR